jgi:HAMP domain-containing protein
MTSRRNRRLLVLAGLAIGAALLYAVSGPVRGWLVTVVHGQ